MKKVVIYTAIFGDYDTLCEPTYLPKHCDFVCFTDQKITSSSWKIVPTQVENNDPVRTARKHKVLAHTLFPDHDSSVWVDGNMLVRGDVNELIEKYLSGDVHMAVYDHMDTKTDKRDCIYDEAKALVALEKEGKYKDDKSVITKQIEGYRSEGYPEHVGLLSSMVLLRKHNEPDVIKVMNLWWDEIRTQSRRDQLSFNYVAWKTNFSFAYLKEDSRDNAYFKHNAHNTSSFMKKIWKLLR